MRDCPITLGNYTSWSAYRCSHICISLIHIHYSASPHHFQLSRLFYCFMVISYGQWLFWIWIGGIGLTMFKCGEWCALAALHKPDWPDWYWDIYHWYWGCVMKLGMLLIKQSRMRIGEISPVLSCGPYSGWGWMIWMTFHEKMCCLTEAFPTTFCSRLIFLLQHGRKMCVKIAQDATHRSSCKPLHDHHSEDTESSSVNANTSVSTARCLQNGQLNLPRARHFLQSTNLLRGKLSQPDWLSMIDETLWLAQSGQVKTHMALWLQL